MLKLIYYAKNFKLISVALLYIIISLFVGEWHPFSRFPMYSSLPNWSYSFYISNLNNQLIPTVAFNTNTGELGHIYGGVCEKYHFKYGDGVETKEQLKIVGENLFNTIANDSRNKFLIKNGIKIHRVYFYFHKGILHTTDDVLYEYPN